MNRFYRAGILYVSLSIHEDVERTLSALDNRISYSPLKPLCVEHVRKLSLISLPCSFSLGFVQFSSGRWLSGTDGLVWFGPISAKTKLRSDAHKYSLATRCDRISTAA